MFEHVPMSNPVPEHSVKIEELFEYPVQSCSLTSRLLFRRTEMTTSKVSPVPEPPVVPTPWWLDSLSTIYRNRWSTFRNSVKSCNRLHYCLLTQILEWSHYHHRSTYLECHHLIISVWTIWNSVVIIVRVEEVWYAILVQITIEYLVRRVPWELWLRPQKWIKSWSSC